VTTPSDEQLLAEHIQGLPDRFELLVRRHSQELFRFLARFTGSQTLAEDVVQEAFLQVHLAAASFDRSRRFKPWLFTIAANKARDALRKNVRRQAAPLDAPVAGSTDERTSYADFIPADVVPPLEEIVNLETRQAVQTIIDDMPENLRSVLLLCYFHEFPYKEIADILNVPLGTVKSRLHAAVRYFAKKWKSSQRAKP